MSNKEKLNSLRKVLEVSGWKNGGKIQCIFSYRDLPKNLGFLIKAADAFQITAKYWVDEDGIIRVEPDSIAVFVKIYKDFELNYLGA